MKKLLLATVAIGLTVVAAQAESRDIERTCKGEFTDMRRIGLTLGDCDLNSISPKELEYIERVCGAPGTIDSDSKPPKCAITVIATPSAPFYSVRKVLMSDKCSGVLHNDHNALHFGGGKGEDEGLCVIAKSEVAKVLAACRIGHFCEVEGTVDSCKDSGECVEITSITSARRK